MGEQNTVWKFQDFTVIQILREINFAKCRSSKLAVFAIFGARILFIWYISAFKNCKKVIEFKIQSLEIC